MHLVSEHYWLQRDAFVAKGLALSWICYKPGLSGSFIATILELNEWRIGIELRSKN